MNKGIAGGAVVVGILSLLVGIYYMALHSPAYAFTSKHVILPFGVGAVLVIIGIIMMVMPSGQKA